MESELYELIAENQANMVRDIAKMWSKEKDFTKKVSIYSIFCDYVNTTIIENSLIEGNRINILLFGKLKRRVAELELLIKMNPDKSDELDKDVKKLYQVSVSILSDKINHLEKTGRVSNM